MQAARKVFGTAIGKSGKEKIFKAYIALELQLGNVDRCRTLYEKYLEVSFFSRFNFIEDSESVYLLS